MRISDAVGDDVFRRAPVNLDTILASHSKRGRSMQDGLLGNV